MLGSGAICVGHAEFYTTFIIHMYMVTWSCLFPNSLMSLRCHKTCFTQTDNDMYSVSIRESATIFCMWLCHGLLFESRVPNMIAAYLVPTRILNHKMHELLRFHPLYTVTDNSWRASQIVKDAFYSLPMFFCVFCIESTRIVDSENNVGV